MTITSNIDSIRKNKTSKISKNWTGKLVNKCLLEPSICKQNSQYKTTFYIAWKQYVQSAL